MLAESILVDFMLGLDSNILIILYKLVSESLNKVIKKVKMIEMEQINILETIYCNTM